MHGNLAQTSKIVTPVLVTSTTVHLYNAINITNE